MKIISPSYKRAKTVKTHKLIENISYAVHEFEKEEYKKEGFDVIVLPDSTKGNIPNVRNWLLDQNFNNEILLINRCTLALLFVVINLDVATGIETACPSKPNRRDDEHSFVLSPYASLLAVIKTLL